MDGANELFYVCMCVCLFVCMYKYLYIYIFMCYVCTYTHKYIMDPCLHQEETNMITAV
jgi:hypothetical protein